MRTARDVRRASRAPFRRRSRPPSGPTSTSSDDAGADSAADARRSPPGSSTMPGNAGARAASHASSVTTSCTGGTRLRPHCSHAATAICRQCARRLSPRSPAGKPRAARRDHRLDRGRAELDRLAHDEIHRVVRGDALHQRDGQRRFALDRRERVEAHPRVALVGAHERRREFAAGAGEQRQRVADARGAARAARDARPASGSAISRPTSPGPRSGCDMKARNAHRAGR